MMMMNISLVKLFTLLYLTFNAQQGSTENYVGCLFSKKVCEDFEACFNDEAFGQCFNPQTEKKNELYKFSLTPTILLLLQREMQRLYAEDYEWDHKYTQCIVQTILDANRYGTTYDPNMCNEKLLMQMEMEAVQNKNELTPKQIEEIIADKEMAEEVSPYDIANIRFEPSINQDLKEFADEIFFPLGNFESVAGRDVKKGQSKKDGKGNDNKRISQSTYDELLTLDYLRKISEDVRKAEEEEKNNPDIIQEDLTEHWDDAENWGLDDDSVDYANSLAKRPKASEDKLSNAVDESNKTHPDNTQATQDDDNEDENDDKTNQDFIDLYDIMGQSAPYDYGMENDGKVSIREDPKMFSTFQRWDRLDTKKPGPEFAQHGQPREEDILNAENMVLNSQKKDELLDELIDVVHQDSSHPDQDNEKDDGAQTSEPLGASTTSAPYIPIRIPVAKKKLKVESKEYVPGYSNSNKGNKTDAQKFDAVQSSYAYLRTDKRIANKDEGRKIVKTLENLLELPSKTFTDIKVDGKQVTFKVNSNPKHMNASVVANKAESLSSNLEKNAGVIVESSGIGDEVKLEVASKNQGQFAFILTFVLVGTAFGVLVAAVVVYIVRRHARTKAKLRNISNQDTEASLDYQDLCRQRMASKTNEKPEPIHVAQAQRISSLSQSEGSAASPTSRSSTSSWSEEPVTSNMDITTGHVILAYMEDHLKNKDRLDREWEALCAYEAEPCSTECATTPNNIKKNRFPNVIPYDHSRVVLTESTNISGSNYINASTITDHDPRTPAYIATQGPLPHTAADFWQMVWEQGSVVIVMLTRLMENGVALCHRYWPEEGSELYHIYEVHLVSEHIWCDDYLIRSFYLKNLKTGETRTVTQFHFLSWPENGVPPNLRVLMDFRRKVNKSFRGRSCPIIIHCSDGSGRTGTYCLIDMVLNRMDKGAKEIDIAATLEHIRDQRVAMVKTKTQFEYVLMILAEEVQAILKAMPN